MNMSKAKDGHGCLRKDGYRSIQINGKRLLEHRYVMSVFLKRPLEISETVHHINGIRSDNRIENLVILSRWGHNTLECDQRNIESAIEYLKFHGYEVSCKTALHEKYS